MADTREVMAAEAQADHTMAVAHATAEHVGQIAYAIVHALNAIRLEIRAQGMRADHVASKASKR